MKSVFIVSALFAVAIAKPSALLTPAFFTAQSPVLSQYHSQDTLGQYAYGYNGGSSAKVETKSIDGITRGSYSYVDAQGLLQTVEYVADAVNGFRAAATNLPKAPSAFAPEPVRDTPEVAQAKAEHIRAYNEAALRAAAEPEIQTVAADPVAQFAPAQILALRSAPLAVAPGSFSYSFNTPLAYPNFIQTPQLVAAPAVITARAGPLAVQVNNDAVPQDTPEVAVAKAEHLQAVEEQKARIAAASAASQ